MLTLRMGTGPRPRRPWRVYSCSPRDRSRLRSSHQALTWRSMRIMYGDIVSEMSHRGKAMAGKFPGLPQVLTVEPGGDCRGSQPATSADLSPDSDKRKIEIELDLSWGVDTWTAYTWPILKTHPSTTFCHSISGMLQKK